HHAVCRGRDWADPTAPDGIARTLEPALELSAARRIRGVLEAMPHPGVDDHDRVIGGEPYELPLERSGVEQHRMARLPEDRGRLVHDPARDTCCAPLGELHDLCELERAE